MAYSIDYPQDWIGIPHFGEGEVFATAEAWADALAGEIVAPLGLFGRKKERRAALAETFAFVAKELEKGGAHWGYAWLASVDGPLRFVAVMGLAREDIGDAPAAELAGADGHGDYVPPIVREITASSGATGVYVERHSPMDDEAPLVQVISGTYAFERPDGVVLLQASTTDMAGYEAFRPHYEEFARSFRWDD
jgi:hypothetical protein